MENQEHYSPKEVFEIAKKYHEFMNEVDHAISSNERRIFDSYYHLAKRTFEQIPENIRNVGQLENHLNGITSLVKPSRMK